MTVKRSTRGPGQSWRRLRAGIDSGRRVTGRCPGHENTSLAGLRALRPAGRGWLVRTGATARDIPDRETPRRGLAGVLHRLGRSRVAPLDAAAVRAGRAGWSDAAVAAAAGRARRSRAGGPGGASPARRPGGADRGADDRGGVGGAVWTHLAPDAQPRRSGRRLRGAGAPAAAVQRRHRRLAGRDRRTGPERAGATVEPGRRTHLRLAPRGGPGTASSGQRGAGLAGHPGHRHPWPGAGHRPAGAAPASQRRQSHRRGAVDRAAAGAGRRPDRDDRRRRRHHRAQASCRAAAPPCLPRPTDRPGEPGTVPRSARARHGPPQSHRRAAGGTAAGPGRVQDCQRRPRARGRRPTAQHCRRPPAHRHAAQRHRGPAGR